MKRLFRTIAFISTSALLTSALVVGAANAQQPSPEERAYKFRTSLFQTFAWKLGQMAGSKGQDDEAAFIKHAKDLSYLSGLIEEGFTIENSLPEGSKAKPEIWQDYAKFQEKAANMTEITNGFTKAGAMADFNPREFGSKTCGSCHRDFKFKD